jgi:hypothetical protein
VEQNLGKTAKIVQHKGVEIIISDYSGLKGRELTAAMKENTKVVVPKIIGRRDCVAVNLFNDCFMDEDSVKYLSKIQKAMDGTFVASALVGMSAVQKTAVEITGALNKSSFTTKFFNSREEAIDWITEEYEKFDRRPR